MVPGEMSFGVWGEYQQAEVGRELWNQPANKLTACQQSGRLALEIKPFSEPQEPAIINTACCCLWDRQAQGLSLRVSW